MHEFERGRLRELTVRGLAGGRPAYRVFPTGLNRLPDELEDRDVTHIPCIIVRLAEPLRLIVAGVLFLVEAADPSRQDER